MSSSTPPGNSAQMFTGLTHAMASRVTEAGTPVPNPVTLPPPYPLTTPRNPTPELLVGADYVATDQSLPPFQHYVGYGTAGFRLQHPEGGDQTNPYPNNPSGTSDLTENRWFRALGFLEVPTRSHRGIDEPSVYVAPTRSRRARSTGRSASPHAGKDQPEYAAVSRHRGGTRRRARHLQHELHAGLAERRELAGEPVDPVSAADITGSDTVASPPPQNPLLATSTPRLVGTGHRHVRRR